MTKSLCRWRMCKRGGEDGWLDLFLHSFCSLPFFFGFWQGCILNWFFSWFSSTLFFDFLDLSFLFSVLLSVHLATHGSFCFVCLRHSLVMVHHHPFTDYCMPGSRSHISLCLCTSSHSPFCKLSLVGSACKIVLTSISLMLLFWPTQISGWWLCL